MTAKPLLRGVMNDFLQRFFVLDHENYRRAFQFRSEQPQTTNEQKKLAVTGAPHNCWENSVKCLQLRRGREHILVCLRQDVRQKDSLQLLLRRQRL